MQITVKLSENDVRIYPLLKKPGSFMDQLGDTILNFVQPNK